MDACTHLEMIKQRSYHDGITGSGGEIDVVRIGGDPTVPLLDVACHILTNTLDALARTVGPFNAQEWTLIQTEPAASIT